jgi:hypothetical protein
MSYIIGILALSLFISLIKQVYFPNLYEENRNCTYIIKLKVLCFTIKLSLLGVYILSLKYKDNLVVYLKRLNQLARNKEIL